MFGKRGPQTPSISRESEISQYTPERANHGFRLDRVFKETDFADTDLEASEASLSPSCALPPSVDVPSSGGGRHTGTYTGCQRSAGRMAIARPQSSSLVQPGSATTTGVTFHPTVSGQLVVVFLWGSDLCWLPSDLIIIWNSFQSLRTCRGGKWDWCSVSTGQDQGAGMWTHTNSKWSSLEPVRGGLPLSQTILFLFSVMGYEASQVVQW